MHLMNSSNVPDPAPSDEDLNAATQDVVDNLRVSRETANVRTTADPATREAFAKLEATSTEQVGTVIRAKIDKAAGNTENN
jgi:hypothetical protein